MSEVVDTQPTIDPTQGQQPVQQPVVQSIAQPAPVPAAQPAPTAKTETTAVDPNSLIGATPLETSINVFSNNTGVNPDVFLNSIQAALQYSDDNLIDVTSLTQGLDPTQAAQAVALAKATYQQVQQEQQRVVAQAHQIAGGQEQWVQALEAFNTHADERTRKYAKFLESEGDIEGAVQHIMQSVQSLGVVNSQQGEFITPSGGSPAQQALSYAEFHAAMGKLQREAGNAMTNPRSPHYQTFMQLQQARELGKRLGR